MGQKKTNRMQIGMLILQALVFCAASVYAWKQEPVRDPEIEPARWDERDYWLHPVERNAHLRLSGIDTPLRTIIELDNGVLFTIGLNGVALRSNDHGQHWQTAHRFHARVEDIHRLSSGEIIAVGSDKGIWRSDNQGLSWQSVFGIARDVYARGFKAAISSTAPSAALYP